MLSLLLITGAVVALDAAALRYGADSRVDDGRPNL
jgi:hypothetical protein